VAVNCSAIPENLLETEFFGARKGSYTGATQDREGYFQAARSGTLFLDEIGDLPLAMQSKLLRAIQERSVRALGSTQEDPVDVRIISATHKDLAADVHAGVFRQDLYYRLNVIPIRLPSLRERREDIRALVMHFVSRANQAHQRNVYLAGDALERLEAHTWPGNIRELGNLVERVVLLADQPLVTGAALARFMPVALAAASPTAQASYREAALARVPEATPTDASAAPLVRDYGSAHSHTAAALQTALDLHQGNQSRAAQSLGLTLRQFGYRLRKAGLK
jgi:Nif-specific regulatory protein